MGAKQRASIADSKPRDRDAADDPGARICGHGDRGDVRIHYLGGGIWVCFACWASLLVGGRPR